MFRQLLPNLNKLACRSVSTVTSTSAAVSTLLPRQGNLPSHVLTTLKTFPHLEPVAVQPISSSVLSLPTRRDILWRAVVHEADCQRAGSSNPPGRSQKGYSRKKLRPQKGTGKARMGDRGSPTRHDGGYAHARNAATNNFATDLPEKLYAKAFLTALSSMYREGKLIVVKGDSIGFKSSHERAMELFVKEHGFEGLRLGFVVADVWGQDKENLFELADKTKESVDVYSADEVDIRDILRPSRLIIEEDALREIVEIYGEI
ncbi:ribosomal protein L4 [Nadsonia fulvescens var. elongata DSM 6958]|uniref:Large ribosomal subunit protein uL4m n=1 Tax=Nadsonia fulvescens var. elongata DSM 6958 TaxID=857566 RepID=A0A1E3PJ40_9ASCO|nr:ribosomal protein L4 [Nadsonia fulvescens var. elongata DSM 6958]